MDSSLWTRESINRFSKDKKRIYFHEKCGACDFFFSVGDPIVALHISSTGHVAVNALEFTVIGTPLDSSDDIVFDPYMLCRSRSAADETTTIHTDCFNLFMKRTQHWPDRLHRLWTLALARNPWPGSPLLLLPSMLSAAVISRANDHIRSISSLHMLVGLPPEIIAMIWAYVPQNDFLRLSRVLEAIDPLDSTSHHEALTVPLRHVHSWYRGTDPIISTKAPRSSIELTIDSRGIKSIQRSKPLASAGQSRFEVYSTIGVNRRFTITFDSGVSRLAQIPQAANLQISDLPNLSPLSGFQFPAPKPSVHLATTSLHRCSGITFLWAFEKLEAIHAHTHAAPTADITFQQLPPRIRHAISWVYVPNPPGDKISVFGVRISIQRRGKLQLKRRVYFIRTPRRGDFFVGRALTGLGKDYAVHTPPQSTLLYSIEKYEGVFIRGVLTEGSSSSMAAPPASAHPPLRYAYYASAQLIDVASIWIFRDEEDGFCRGLIVEYLDGTERALGTCRIGVDPAEKCLDVGLLSFKATKRRSLYFNRVVMMRTSQESNGLDSAGWTTCSEGDTLQVWATVAEMVMTTT